MKNTKKAETKETAKKQESIETIRHSCSHIMASAIKKLFPDVKLGIGPTIEEGFYYDFDTSHKFTPEDFTKIEKEMNKIIEKNEKFERKELTAAEAKKLFKSEPYKLELIKELENEGEKISIYKTGDFVDLCRGPHVSSSREIKAFKLMKVAGAYWKGDEKNKQLQRIYGTAFESEESMKKYLILLEETKKRDHRIIGKQQDLFSFHDEAPGMPFFHAKGIIIWNELLNFWRVKHREACYVEVKTPIILNKKLWLQSGHWDHYKENMYFTKIDEQDYAVKPMNCPGGILVYKTNMHSYKELPLRIAEVGLVHRHELSGVLNGLFRVRCFHQDDAHLFVTPELLEQEIIGIIDLIDAFYKMFGFEYNVELSTKPEKAMGAKELWDKAELALKKALEHKKMKYKLNPGEGAFYGPKIDFHIKDAIGRTWQCGTIQVDFQMPEKFELSYEGSDGLKHQPIILHRTIYGSLERFIGILIENYTGAFPVWLSPVQISIITVADRHLTFAEKLKEELFIANIRVELDSRQESIGKKVHDNQALKIPYVITVGDREIESKQLAVRTRDGKVENYKKEDFIKKVLKEIETRA